MGQDEMSARRLELRELPSSRLKRGFRFVSRLCNSCIELVEGSKAAEEVEKGKHCLPQGEMSRVLSI